jgi:hypothetical protein
MAMIQALALAKYAAGMEARVAAAFSEFEVAWGDVHTKDSESHDHEHDRPSPDVGFRVSEGIQALAFSEWQWGTRAAQRAAVLADDALRALQLDAAETPCVSDAGIAAASHDVPPAASNVSVVCNDDATTSQVTFTGAPPPQESSRVTLDCDCDFDDEPPSDVSDDALLFHDTEDAKDVQELLMRASRAEIRLTDAARFLRQWPLLHPEDQPADLSQSSIRACQTDNCVLIALVHERICTTTAVFTTAELAAHAGSVGVVRFLLSCADTTLCKELLARMACAPAVRLHVLSDIMLHPLFDGGVRDNFIIRRIGRFTGAHACEVVSALLTRPDVDPTAGSNEALCLACAAGHSDIVACLLADPRVNPNEQSPYGLHAPFESALFNRNELAALLVLRHPRTRVNANMFFKACNSGLRDVISAFLHEHLINLEDESEVRLGPNQPRLSYFDGAFKLVVEKALLEFTDLTATLDIIKDFLAAPQCQPSSLVVGFRAIGTFPKAGLYRVQQVLHVLLADARVDFLSDGNRVLFSCCKYGSLQTLDLMLSHPNMACIVVNSLLFILWCVPEDEKRTDFLEWIQRILLHRRFSPADIVAFHMHMPRGLLSDMFHTALCALAREAGCAAMSLALPSDTRQSIAFYTRIMHVLRHVAQRPPLFDAEFAELEARCGDDDDYGDVEA